MLTCPDCPLSLRIKRAEIYNGLLEKLIVDLEYQPSIGTQRARLMDMYIATEPPLDLVSLEEGEALKKTAKHFAINENTGEPWKEAALGEYRLTVLSSTNTTLLDSGNLAEMEFTFSRGSLLFTSVQLNIERHNSILAPEDADGLLQISPYDNAAIIEIVY